MVDRLLKLNAPVNATIGAPVPAGGVNVPPSVIITSRNPNPQDPRHKNLGVWIGADDRIDFVDDFPLAPDDAESYTLWERSTHSLVLRKKYENGDPDKLFVFAIVSEELTSKNDVLIWCWQLCQFPADHVAYDVNESHRAQCSWYIDACKAKGIEPDWGEHAEQIADAADAMAQDNAWDTFVAENPAPKEA